MSLAAATCDPSIRPTTPTADFTLDEVNGTATHARTGLTWMRCSLGQSWDSATRTCTGTRQTYRWGEALRAARGHAFAGHNDWRIPNAKELQTIIERQCYNSAINETVFPGIGSSGWYWSSSVYAHDPGYAWLVVFDDGYVDAYDKTLSRPVRLVRGGQSFGDFTGETTAQTLAISKTGTGAGRVTSTPTGIDCGAICSAAFPAGTAVTLTAAPDANSAFAGWSGDCSGTGACTVTMNADRNVTAAFENVIYVTTPEDAGPGSLRDAIAQAESGDVIELTPSLAGQAIVLNTPITIGGASRSAAGFDFFLILRWPYYPGYRGWGRAGRTEAQEVLASPIIRGAGQTPLFVIGANASVTLEGLTLTNGYNPGDGGAIDNAGQVTVKASRIQDNVAQGNGGGIYNRSGATLLVDQSTLSGNRSSGNGGGIANAGLATLKIVTLYDNHALAGGGLYTLGDLKAYHLTASQNHADNYGGGLVVTGSAGLLTLGNSLIVGNTAGNATSAELYQGISGRYTGTGANLIGQSGVAGVDPASLTGYSVNPLTRDQTLKPLTTLPDEPVPLCPLVRGSVALDVADSDVAAIAGITDPLPDLGAAQGLREPRFESPVADTISWFYAAAFARTPVPNSSRENYGELSGLTYWTNQYLGGPDAQATYINQVYAIADFFVASGEFQAQYPATLTSAEFVTALYRNMLGREPDTGGRDYWTGLLDGGTSRGTVLAQFTNSPENRDANPLRKAALASFIAFIDADADRTITVSEAAAWLAAHPTLDGALVDAK